MQNTTIFPIKVPDWLLNLEVADELFAAAYDKLPDLQRAWLKTCLARHHAVLGDPKESRTVIEHFKQGFEIYRHEEAADWALIVLDENFSSGPRFMAALAPALLSGVKAVYVLRVIQDSILDGKAKNCSGTTCPQAILVAAELAGLAGQGQFFEVSLEQACEFLKTLGQPVAQPVTGQGMKNSQGRLLMLGESFWGEALILEASKLGVTTWNRGMLPVQGEKNSTVINFKFTEFHALHPDLEVIPDKISETENSKLKAALQYSCFAVNPGQEGVWFWPELNENFFLKRHFCISSSKQSEENLDLL